MELKEVWKKFKEFCDSINVPLEQRGYLWENKLKRDKERGAIGSSCNPWGGPWICTNCKVGWQQWNIDHPPKHCPGCDDVDSFRKITLNDLGCKEIVI